jgi:hypothetical protein
MVAVWFMVICRVKLDGKRVERNEEEQGEGK